MRKHTLVKGAKQATSTATSAPAPIVSRDTILDIPIGQIINNPFQPRKESGELAGMIGSIQEHGIQQPVTAKDNGDGSYTLIAGQRRLDAARAAGQSTVPVILRTGDPAILALIENLQRENLKPLEEAAAFKRLLDGGETQQSLAQKLAIPRDRIAQAVRMLALPSEAAFLLDSGEISPSAARQVLRLDIFDRIATTESIMGTWANYYAHHILWGPNYFRTTADVQYGVDYYLCLLHMCSKYNSNSGEQEARAIVNRDMAQDEAEREAEAKGKAKRKPRRTTLCDSPAYLFLLVKPDFSKVTETQCEEIERSFMRWIEEHNRRYPPRDLEAGE